MTDFFALWFRHPQTPNPWQSVFTSACTSVCGTDSQAGQLQLCDTSTAQKVQRVGGSREGTGTYKQHQLGGGLDWGAAWKFLTLYTPWLAGLSSVPAKTAAVVLQKYGKRRIRMEMSSLMGCGLHPPFSMVGDSCHVHDCKFPASWHELNTSSDLMGLLILLTSFEFFHLSFSVSHPKF